MPKKTFRTSNSKVVIKRSKFNSIARHKVNNKRPKLILIDEKNEINWKSLKSELGYKTDSLFLEYLLSLAERDLNSFRSRKRQVSSENEESLKTLDYNYVCDNEKRSESPFGPHRTKSRNCSDPVENEKKKDFASKTNDAAYEVKKVVESIARISNDVNDSRVCGNGTDGKSRSDPTSLFVDAKSSKFEDKSTKNLKTESAKDLDLDCIKLNDRIREQGSDESSTNNDLNMYSSSERHRYSQAKTLSAIDEISSLAAGVQRSPQIGGIFKKERTRCQGKATKVVSREKESVEDVAHAVKNDEDAEIRKRTSQGYEAIESGDVKYGDEAANDFRLPGKIKFCGTCNKRHVVGDCPRSNSGFASEDDLTEVDRPENPFNRDSHSLVKVYFSSGDKVEDGNVYDFDDNEKEINVEGSSRWSRKLSKANESVETGNGATKRDVLRDRANVNLPPATAAVGNNVECVKARKEDNVGENINFSQSSLPAHLLLKVADEAHGQSVFTKVSIAKSTCIGPLIGQKIREMDIADDFDMKYIWEVNSPEGVAYVSTKDPETSNWLRFLRPATSRDSANLMSTVKESSLYFLSTRDIADREELVYWMDDAHSAWSKKKLEKKNCGGCNIRFSHALYYRRHCMIFHDPTCSLTIRKYHCKICGLAVLGKEKIMKHAAEMHQGKGAYQCQYCSKFFLRLNYLEMHRTYGCSKNPQRSRPLCDLCGRKFCQPQKLKVHIKRMHSDMAQVLKDFQCKSCLKILGSRAALQRHMKEVHNKDIVGACTCDRCGKMFQNKSNLKIHMLTHSGVKPFKCQQSDCTAAFTTKQCLQFHYRKVHGFTDDFIPKIERSIAYTFDAYSGGTVSEPSTGRQSPRFEERHSPVPESRECGLDLSLVTPAENAPRGPKEKVKESQSGSGFVVEEEDKSMSQTETRSSSKEEAFARSPEFGDEETGSKRFVPAHVARDGAIAIEGKAMVSKGSKKWMASDAASDAKGDDRFKSIFRHENANASLLVEAAINAAEKDIIDRPAGKCSTDALMDNPPEMYSISHAYATAPSPGAVAYESSEKKLDDYGKMPVVAQEQKEDSFQEVESKKMFPSSEKTNFNDFLRCSSLLRINTSPVNEIPKDYNISSIIRDQEAESFADIEIQDYRNRDLLETYKDGEGFHEPYKAHELYRNDKLDLYRGGESDLRISDKFEYRDFDLVSNETYRNLATNLEKYRGADLYRLRNESYELGYREPGDERDGEAQNLCLKEKSFQYDTLEELARIGRDNPGFECLLVGDSGNTIGNQSFGAPAPRSLHGMLSPRSYHPTYEGESVDLSVPRPSYSSSPIYTLDLTPSRVDLPARHLDFRTHLGLSPHRFPNSRMPPSSQVSPNGYNVYSSPYVSPSTRHSPTPQFQPYTSLYY